MPTNKEAGPRPAAAHALTSPNRSRRIVFVCPNASVDRLYEVERLTIGEIHRPEFALTVPGGKGLNAARAASAMGGRVTAIAIIAGHSGDWVAGQLAMERVDFRAVRDHGDTRTCLSVLDRSTGRLTEFYERGSSVGEGTWERLEATLAGELDHDDVGAVVISGSLPPGAPIDGYGRLLRRIRSPDILTLVDVSGATLLSALDERPTVVKLNATEAALSTGRAVRDERDAVRAAGWLTERGAARVVITLGESGAIAYEKGMTWRFARPGAHGAYPVGSGDAFMAGLALALIDGSNLADAVTLGMAAAVANAQAPGAGRLDPATVAKLRGVINPELRSTLEE